MPISAKWSVLNKRHSLVSNTSDALLMAVVIASCLHTSPADGLQHASRLFQCRLPLAAHNAKSKKRRLLLARLMSLVLLLLLLFLLLLLLPLLFLLLLLLPLLFLLLLFLLLLPLLFVLAASRFGLDVKVLTCSSSAPIRLPLATALQRPISSSSTASAGTCPCS